MTAAQHIIAAYPKAASIADDIVRVAHAVGAHPYDLANLIDFESGRTFSPSVRHPQSQAVGLIQFHPHHARSTVGLSADALSRLGAVEQMEYVQKYLDTVRQGAALDTPFKLFMSVFYPAAMSWEPTRRFPSNVTAVNPGISTPADYVRYATRHAKLPSSSDPGTPTALELDPPAALEEPRVGLTSAPLTFPLTSPGLVPAAPPATWALDPAAHRNMRLADAAGPHRPGALPAGLYKVEVWNGRDWVVSGSVDLQSGRSYFLTARAGRIQMLLLGAP